MAGLKGVAHIADDLVVHGGRNLTRIWSRFWRGLKKNLTQNADKCTFRMTKIVLMGLLLTKHGIGPMEEKVKAIIEGSKP